MKCRHVRAVVFAGLLMTLTAPHGEGATLTAESFSQDIYLSGGDAIFDYRDFNDVALVGDDWDNPIRQYPQLDLVVSWYADILSREQYQIGGLPYSSYRIGGGHITVSVLGPRGVIGTMKGKVGGVELDVEDFSGDDDPGGDPDGEWTDTGGSSLRLSRDLARYLGVKRVSGAFTIDVLPDFQNSDPSDEERNFRIGCCSFVYIDLEPVDQGPSVPEVPPTALVALGLAATAKVWRRRVR
jgi:hypothetical protein